MFGFCFWEQKQEVARTAMRKTNVALYKQQEDVTLPPARGAAGPGAAETKQHRDNAGARKEGSILLALFCDVNTFPFRDRGDPLLFALFFPLSSETRHPPCLGGNRKAFPSCTRAAMHLAYE